MTTQKVSSAELEALKARAKKNTCKTGKSVQFVKNISPEELRAARAKLKMTRGQLGHWLGLVGDKTVSKWEQGIEVPGPAISKLIRLALKEPLFVKVFEDEDLCGSLTISS